MSSRNGRRTPAILAAGAALSILLGGLAAIPASAAAPFDLGDAPASYDTTSGDPARATLTGPLLGATATADQIAPKTNVSVSASDSATGDSGDDAVSGFDPMRVGRLATIKSDITVSQVTHPARVCGWIDFNQSGSFSSAERSCADAAAGSTQVQLSWIGRPAGVGTSYVRLRIGLNAAQVEQPTGVSDTGEVEDYPVTVAAAAAQPDATVSLVKTAKPTTMSAVGQVVTYTFSARNTGTVPLSRVEISDELPGLSSLACDGTAVLAPGGSRTCTATREVTQDDLDFGSIFNFAEVTAEAAGGDPDDASDDITALDDATVTTTVHGALSVTSAASATAVSEGTRVTWTFTATNTGNVTLTGARISTGLKGMSALICTPKTGASLAPGETVTCTGDYTVTRPDAERRKLTVTATARADEPYGDPTTTGDDVVGRVSQTLTVAKPTSPAGGSGSTSGGGSSADAGTESGEDGLAATGGPGLAALAGFASLSLAGATMTGLGRRRRRR